MGLGYGDTFHAGQLVILHKAGLAGTLSLDRITQVAEGTGAKVLLVGDPFQFQAVEAAGSFGLLVGDRDDAPQLTTIHRFTHEWEKRASLGIRLGEPAVIDVYAREHRITGGETDAMIDAAYTAWRQDRSRAGATLLVTDSTESVTALNQRARTDLVLAGLVRPSRGEVVLNDGSRAAAGDTVITRRNDRRLRAGRNWVRNGNRWTVTSVRRDGSATIRPAGITWGGRIVLPAAYVAEHLDLGYAVTSSRAQGVTVDTAHVLVDPSMPRENLYVALTRGKDANHAYVATDAPDDAHQHPHEEPDPDAAARRVLFGVLHHSGAELSAHETMAAEQERWGSLQQLAAEYETIATEAQRDRWTALIRSSGLTDAQVTQVLDSDALGALAAELRRAEANNYAVDALLPRLVRARGLDDAADLASVLHYRVAAATASPPVAGRTRRAARLIVGLVPVAVGVTDPEMREALAERHRLIVQRVTALAEQALEAGAAWTGELGPRPERPA